MTDVTCANCGVLQQVEGSAACAQCGWLVFEPRPGPAVVIAHENRDVARQIGEVLQRAGFTARPVASGTRAVSDLTDVAGLVVDVGLVTDLMAFQVVESVRADPECGDTPVILVASVYNKTAYKRRPSDLYGADDYVEQHHITDMLPSKLCALLGIDPAGVSALMTASEASAVNARLAGASQPKDDSVAKAAYTIVADIALYHQIEFERVAAGADAAGLEPVLLEGSRVLAKLTGMEMDAALVPVRSAFSALIDDMRKGVK